MKVCAKTDIGYRHEENEDAYIVLNSGEKNEQLKGKDSTFLAVLDGMSGHIGGKLASQMAVEKLQRYVEEIAKTPEISSADTELIITKLKRMICRIDDKICDFCDHNEKYQYMGTTLSALLFSKNRAFIVHVGDSRIYRLRGKKLERLTQDDTMAQLSVEMGLMSAKEAMTHPLRHSLIQAVGQGIDQVYTRIESVRSGDVFLLCSDGLYDMVDENVITKILLTENQAYSPCDRLIKEALKNGGRDNVTVIVAKVE